MNIGVGTVVLAENFVYVRNITGLILRKYFEIGHDSCCTRHYSFILQKHPIILFGLNTCSQKPSLKDDTISARHDSNYFRFQVPAACDIRVQCCTTAQPFS